MRPEGLALAPTAQGLRFRSLTLRDADGASWISSKVRRRRQLSLCCHGAVLVHQEQVRPEGLEPPTLSGQDPKSCASANFATAANLMMETSAAAQSAVAVASFL